MTSPPRIVIIGGGFSGSMTAVHLLRASGGGANVTLIERRATPGPGLAYSTTFDAHLLNVPAARMSAFPDDPNHFLDWASHTLGHPVEPTDFLPRSLFGAYIRSVLADAIAKHPGALRPITGEATNLRIDPHTHGVTVDLAHGATITGDGAVLALGNPTPSDPPVRDGTTFYESDRYIRDPWRVCAFDGLDPRAPVMLIGTGLTMLDIALALVDRGHTGPITAVSRRGLIPRPHVHPPAPPSSHGPAIAAGASPLEALRAVRDAVRTHDDWRPVIDTLRPVTASVWSRWSHLERSAFLRHLRPRWDVHRHRAAPNIGVRIDQLIASGTLRIVGGRLLAWAPAPKGVIATIGPRGSDVPLSIEAARVFNCTGPTQDLTRVKDPLVRSLIATGILSPDPHTIGAHCDADGRVLDAGGNPHRSLWLLGAWRSAQLWESVAVPELRMQAAGVAAAILATATGAPGITPSST